jgi:iron complex transport system substrate-binding protein
MSQQPHVLSLTPRNLAEIEENILAIGDATGRREAAELLVDKNRERLRRVLATVGAATPRPVTFLEWTEPLFCGGHWVPEMVAAAGGEDPLGQPGSDSQRMTWDDVAASEPEMLIVAPCGYGLKDAIAVAKRLPRTTDAEVYAVDANAYFARPGPRVAEGVEVLAHLFHPDKFAWPHEHRPWERIR